MSTLALFGGTPVSRDVTGGQTLKTRRDLEREYLVSTHESGIWDDWPGMESATNTFEKEWAEFCGSNHCVLLTNGTHTLQLALESLDIGYGDEVIVPGLTWQATASVVCDVNAVPVLVDIDPETLCIDPEKAEAAITPNTRAIIPVHLYHRMADLDRIVQICKNHNLHLIEDCAHTHGSRWDGSGAGTFGKFGSFSFQSSKLVNSGEGGALIMQDEELYWKVVSQRSCGREFNGIKIHNGNYRITGFQAAVLRGQLAAYRENAEIIDKTGLLLDKAVSDAPGVKPLKRHEKITRQCSYCFLFLYDKEAYDGLDADLFRNALTAELGITFDSTYAPLLKSEVYYPQTKKRHYLTDGYRNAITPEKWILPECDRAFADTAVKALWHIFAVPPENTGLLTDAIEKIYKNRHELMKNGKGAR